MSDRRDELPDLCGDHDPDRTALKPRPYQNEGIAFLASRARALLFDDPGLGKTVQAIRAHIACSDGGAVIVCPAVAVGVWEEEVRKWSNWPTRVQEKTTPVEPPGSGEFLVTTYSRAKLLPGRFSTLILDEAHQVKSPKSNRSKKCAELVKSAGRVWALTGTPIQRDPWDLWGILCLLGVDRASYGTRTRFISMFGGARKMGHVEWTAPTRSAWAPLRHWHLERKREFVLDLPDRVHEDIFVKLPKRAETRYAEIAERYPADSEDWEKWATGGELASALADLSLVKAAAVLPEIEQFNPSRENPLVIFSAHRGAAKLLAEALGWPVISGETPADQRTKIANEFQMGKYPGLIATIRAAGVGLTLTKAATALFISRTYVPAENSQAEDRLYRIGQTRNVRVIYCRSKSPLEFAVDRVLRRKAPYV